MAVKGPNGKFVPQPVALELAIDAGNTARLEQAAAELAALAAEGHLRSGESAEEIEWLLTPEVEE